MIEAQISLCQDCLKCGCSKDAQDFFKAELQRRTLDKNIIITKDRRDGKDRFMVNLLENERASLLAPEAAKAEGLKRARQVHRTCVR